MVFFNHATRQMTAKIVYYGPGLCGKTTNLNTIYGRTSQKARGEMVSLNTETDRTLFFDLLPLDVGTIGGFKTKLQLYTVPGQVFYNSTRKLVLKGVDGIVFVADSQTPMQDANRESLQNLGDNLRELGMVLEDIPMVFQWNKRDLKQILPVEQLEAELNARQLPSYLAIASEGSGVFETLRGITKLALAHIKIQHLADLVDGRGARDDAQAPPELKAPSRVNGEAGAGCGAPVVPSLPVTAPQVELAPAVALPRIGMPRISSSVAKPGKAIALPAMPKPVVHVPVPRPVVVRPVAPAPLALAFPDGLRIPLPGSMDESEVEIRVQVVQGGRVLGETSMKKAAPQKGAAERVALVLKRS